MLAAGVLFLTLCLLSFGPTQVEVFTIPGRSSPFPSPPLPKGAVASAPNAVRALFPEIL